MNSDLEVQLLISFLLSDAAAAAEKGQGEHRDLAETIDISRVLGVGPTELAVITNNGDSYRVTIRKVDE